MQDIKSETCPFNYHKNPIGESISSYNCTFKISEQNKKMFIMDNEGKRNSEDK